MITNDAAACVPLCSPFVSLCSLILDSSLNVFILFYSCLTHYKHFVQRANTEAVLFVNLEGMWQKVRGTYLTKHAHTQTTVMR